GLATTDDKGQYRVWGLMPGDYYVTATARGFMPIVASLLGAAGPAPGFAGRGGGPGAGRLGAFVGAADQQEPVAYAPTYFPGAPSVNEATAVTLSISQEALDVSFALQLVRTARITGRASSADGT